MDDQKQTTHRCKPKSVGFYSTGEHAQSHKRITGTNINHDKQSPSKIKQTENYYQKLKLKYSKVNTRIDCWNQQKNNQSSKETSFVMDNLITPTIQLSDELKNMDFHKAAQ